MRYFCAYVIDLEIVLRFRDSCDPYIRKICTKIALYPIQTVY
jgi:hypothetical protein